MKIDKNLTDVSNICELVQSLPLEQLNNLLGSPLLGTDILEHAAFCKECGKIVERASASEFSGLPAPQRSAFEKIGRDIAASTHPSGKLITQGDTVNSLAGVLRRAVERWVPGPAVAIASGGESSNDVDKFAVRAEILSDIGLQPYIRLDLIGVRDKPTIRIQVQRTQDTSRPGRYLQPKRRLIQFSLIRPNETIRVELGSSSAETPFRDSIQRPLKRYTRGEELRWQAELRIMQR